MQPSEDWKTYWDQIGDQSASDFDYDHHRGLHDSELEQLSQRELIAFIDPQAHEEIFDAGCGTGTNMFSLCPHAKLVSGIDFAQSAVTRCQQRIVEKSVPNVHVAQGSVTELQLPDRSVDKIICLSVFQYLTDDQVRQAMSEFRRVLRSNGVLVIHVKNRSSIYLSTLMLYKRIKQVLGRQTHSEYVRTFRWYMSLMRTFGFDPVDYNSFNVLMVDKMPQRMVLALKRLELRFYMSAIYRLPLVRRHGSDLKIKGRLSATSL